MKKILVVFCVIAVFSGIFALMSNKPVVGQPPVNDNSQPGGERGSRQDPLPANAPEHIVYGQFFRHLISLKDQAKKNELKSKKKSKLRTHYKDKIGLKDDKAEILDNIAAESVREMAQTDEKAKKIIDEAYSLFPDGKIPQGQQLPPPPKELKKLQHDRDMSILKARQKLRKKLGDYDFQLIDDYIKINFARQIKSSAVNPQ
jgi:hypothetical protein